MRTAALGSCSLPNGDANFPANSQKVVLRVSGGELEAPLVQAFDRLDVEGQARVDEIPPGEGMTVDVVACAEDGAATWAGVSGVFDILEIGAETVVDIFLTPQNQFARTGRCPDSATDQSHPASGHAYGAITVDGDSAWILGGFGQMSGKSLQASDAVEAYDRNTSRFASAGALSEPRAMALVQPVGDGLVRLVGGVAEVTAAEYKLPSLAATAGPANGIEYYDVTTGQPAGTVDQDFPALPSVVGLADGRAVVVGGAEDLSDPDAPVYSKDAWVVPAGQPTATEIAQRRLDLGLARYGATVVPAGDGVLVWGGAVEREDSLEAPPIAQWIDADTDSVTVLDVAAGVANTMFGAGQHIDTVSDVHRFVVLGGARIDFDAEPPYNLAVNGAHGVLVTVDAQTGSVDVADLTSLWPSQAGQLQRAGASIYALTDDSFWFVGGYQSFTASDPGPCGEAGVCMPPQTLGLQFTLNESGTLDASAEVSHSLPAQDGWNTGPFGAMAAQQFDGSWLVIPGFSTESVKEAASTSAAPTGQGALIRFEVAAAELCEVDVEDELSP
ncbi:MAG: hypothetical protein QF464_06845 [Myxococcota bacterium]|nr:hypothetical protein [Myxococcota bacterium]